MFTTLNVSDKREAGSLLGVRICAILVSLWALLSAVFCILFVIVTFLDFADQSYKSGTRALFIALCTAALTYLSLRTCIGLFRGSRLGQLGGIAWGVLLLFFCWGLVHHARGPINPKAPDAQELDGPMFLLSSANAIWLVGYLSRRRVSAKFLGLGRVESS